MKVSMIAVALSVLATTASAFAANSPDANAPRNDVQHVQQWAADAGAAKVKTRAEVRRTWCARRKTASSRRSTSCIKAAKNCLDV